jgi:nitrogen fixation NifU-like protein
VIRIEVEMRGDAVRAARFQGDGCAISLAGASMLTEMIVGSNITAGDIISGEELLSALESYIQPTLVKAPSARGSPIRG